MTLNGAFEVLTTPAPKLSDETARSVLRKHYGIDGSISALVSERDQNFRVEDSSGKEFVLKIANSAEAAAVTDFQTAALRHVELNDPGFPVPRVLPTATGDYGIQVSGDDDRTHIARLQSWLSGVPLRFVEDKPENSATLGSFLARLGLALKSFEHAASDHVLLWDLKQAGGLAGLLEHIGNPSLRRKCQRLLQHFVENIEPELAALRTQVIYNDLNPSNILVDPANPERVTGIIDFGDMVKSPLVVDVAVGAAYLCKDDDEPLADVLRFLQGYDKVCQLQDREKMLLFDLLITRHVMTIMITNWRATRYPDNREYILRNEPGATRTIDRLSDLNAGEVARLIQETCSG